MKDISDLKRCRFSIIPLKGEAVILAQPESQVLPGIIDRNAIIVPIQPHTQWARNRATRSKTVKPFSIESQQERA